MISAAGVRRRGKRRLCRGSEMYYEQKRDAGGPFLRSMAAKRRVLLVAPAIARKQERISKEAMEKQEDKRHQVEVHSWGATIATGFAFTVRRRRSKRQRVGSKSRWGERRVESSEVSKNATDLSVAGGGGECRQVTMPSFAAKAPLLLPLPPSFSFWGKESRAQVGASSGGLESKYELLGELGRGRFGSVFACKDLATGESWACKRFDRKKFFTEQDAEEVQREVEVMRLLVGDAGLVQLREVVVEEEGLSIVMERCGGGDLFDAVQEKGYLSEVQTGVIFREIVEAVEACHQKGVVHRDLKPENILLTSAYLFEPSREKEFFSFCSCGGSDGRDISLSSKQEAGRGLPPSPFPPLCPSSSPFSMLSNGSAASLSEGPQMEGKEREEEESKPKREGGKKKLVTKVRENVNSAAELSSKAGNSVSKGRDLGEVYGMQRKSKKKREGGALESTFKHEPFASWSSSEGPQLPAWPFLKYNDYDSPSASSLSSMCRKSIPTLGSSSLSSSLSSSPSSCFMAGPLSSSTAHTCAQHIRKARVKLADFGLSIILQPGQTVKGMAGSPFYMAPEVLLGQEYAFAADVWSLGVILYILLSGCPPFSGSSDSEIFDAVRKGRVTFHGHPWPEISAEAKEMVMSLLHLEAGRRPTVSEIRHHPWLKKFGT